MSDDPTMRPLGAVAENLDSLRRPVKASDRSPGSYPYYGAQGIVDYVDEFLFDGEFVLVAEDGENLKSRKENIALIARGKFWVNNHAHILRGNKEADTRFLFYAINSTDISGYVTGSTIPKLSQGSLNRLLIPCPRIEEQRAIASLLGALDDKIELNRQMNETLEAMARLFFKDWFVDFGPTRAKAEGRQPYLAQELWSLFPDALDDDDKPMGWESITAEDFCESVRDGTHDSPKPQDTGRYLITSRHIIGSEVDLSKAYRISQADFDEINRRSKVDQWDVLITMIGTVGETLLVREQPDFAIKNIGLFKSKDRVHGDWFYLYLNSPATQYHIKSHQSGTTQSYIPLGQLRRIPVIAPPKQILSAFGEITSPLSDQITNNLVENRSLSELRDLLLPKLMSGEIRLREAEKLVEQVA